MVIRGSYPSPDGAGPCQRCGTDGGRYVPRLDACLCEDCFEIVQRGR